MNISKLHPVGYEAKTEQGNTYKKSNIYKTIALSSATALNILPYCLPNKKFVNIFSTSAFVDDLANSLNKKFSPLLEKTLKVTMVGLDYLAFYLLGNLSDNKLNQKRALEADLTNNSIDKK